MTWIFQSEERGCYRTLSADLIGTDIPEFCQDTSCIFYLIEEGIHLMYREGCHQFSEALRTWIESGKNTETPGNMRNLHMYVVSLAGWPHHNV